jgi:hypothetical protein
MFSGLFKLTRCVKQGGILSGALFNFYIDDLIKECAEAGLGAMFLEIVMCILGFCDDISLLSPIIEDLQKLLNICGNYGNNWGIEFNLPKCQFTVFGSNRFNNTILLLNNLPLAYTQIFKYLGIDFTYDLNMSNFFIEKFIKVKNSYFSLNAFGFKPGGISPFTQAYVYKTFCISRILYGLEIMNLNKKTINTLNLNQNTIVRYMTGLSKHSHVSIVLKALKLFSFQELYHYMKFIFVKNLKNNNICSKIFEYLQTSSYRNRPGTKSFIGAFKNACKFINQNESYVIENITSIISTFKTNCREMEMNDENELIVNCLQNNQELIMINQLNFLTYAGQAYKI